LRARIIHKEGFFKKIKSYVILLQSSRTQIWNFLGFFRKLDWNSSGILRDSLKFMEFQKISGTKPFAQLFPPRIVALEQSWFCFF
jgi:hypothetical protein